MKFFVFLTLAITTVFSSHHEAVHPPHSDENLSSNLLDSSDFFVCGSKVPGMNGHYILQTPDVVQSDPDTPVFFREDEDEKEDNLVTDFRLFRHNGFWMIADVEPWPPVTHFRCDPTKTQVVGIDVSKVCGLGQLTPPRIGYSPADTKLGDYYLTLHRHACQELQIDNTPSSSNFSIRMEEL